MNAGVPLKKTCLHGLHISLGARMAPFGGWDMPIQYTGIIREHEAARTGATLFDTCHMGEFHVEGPTALADLERLVTCDMGTLRIGQCRYGLLCNDAGGALDDLLVYRLADAAFMIVVNASTQDGDFAWISSRLSRGTTIRNLAGTVAKIDLQGPASPYILTSLTQGLTDPGFYRFTHVQYRDRRTLVSRTGYTGEIGFEVYTVPEEAAGFWKAAMDLGAVPAGLGARDTLRLEMGMPLYGHELSAERNAAESGFTRAISTGKSFIGANAVRDPARAPQRLCGIAMEGRRAARNGDKVEIGGRPAGVVTSGSFAPSVGKAVALAYVNREYATQGTGVNIITERGTIAGKVVSLPFYRNATGRRPMRDFM